MQNSLPQGIRVLRSKECQVLVGVSRATWFDWNNPASPRHQQDMPKRVRLGPRCVGWYEHELISWLRPGRRREQNDDCRSDRASLSQSMPSPAPGQVCQSKGAIPAIPAIRGRNSGIAPVSLPKSTCHPKCSLVFSESGPAYQYDWKSGMH